MMLSEQAKSKGGSEQIVVYTGIIVDLSELSFDFGFEMMSQSQPLEFVD